jgi:hypothetical protein
VAKTPPRLACRPNVRAMADVRAPPPPAHEEPDECLHCAIVDMVEERIAKGGADVGDLATLIAESLVDLILLVPMSEQAKLLAHTVSALGDLFLQKSGVDGGGSGSRH